MQNNFLMIVVNTKEDLQILLSQFKSGNWVIGKKRISAIKGKYVRIMSLKERGKYIQGKIIDLIPITDTARKIQNRFEICFDKDSIITGELNPRVKFNRQPVSFI